MMKHLMVCPLNIAAHVPVLCSFRLLLARVLSIELRNAFSFVWGLSVLVSLPN